MTFMFSLALYIKNRQQTRLQHSSPQNKTNGFLYGSNYFFPSFFKTYKNYIFLYNNYHMYLFSRCLSSLSTEGHWLFFTHQDTLSGSENNYTCYHFMGNKWGNSGNSVRLHFWGLQNHCRWWFHHEIKRRFLLGRKVMTNLDSIFKSRDITLPTKVYLVKTMVFPVVIYGCESCTIKKGECQRIHTFKLRCWRRHLRVSWTERRSN